MAELLFSYGTLCKESVQQAQFGRMLEGRSDALGGWRMGNVEITDPDVLASSGERFHPIAFRSEEPTDRIKGMVFELTRDELAAADTYEVDDYRRISVRLESGDMAWIYVSSAPTDDVE